jgi:sugar O-acyltransferase (sialic acid O-acetyltransferase NeuD family)
MKEKIVIIGGGGHSKVLINVLYKLRKYKILGYTDIKDKGEILGIKYIGGDDILKEIISHDKKCNAAIGVGMVNINIKRENIFNRLIELGYCLPQIISPTSIVNMDVNIGIGSVILDGVIINSGTKIGQGCIINTNSTIEHDCVVDNFSQISPGAILSGGVKVGKHCLIGAGASIKQYVNIKDFCVIGSGSTVIKDCDQSGIYVGIPANLKT